MNNKNISYIKYYKEITLFTGNKVVESGFINYEHIYNSLKCKINNNNGTQNEEL